MSRSYKHTPRCGERKGKQKKRVANHKVRRMKLREDIPQFAGYRKLYERWDICDYETIGLSFDAYCQKEYRWWASSSYRDKEEAFPDRQTLQKEYNKWYIRK